MNNYNLTSVAVNIEMAMVGGQSNSSGRRIRNQLMQISAQIDSN